MRKKRKNIIRRFRRRGPGDPCEAARPQEPQVAPAREPEEEIRMVEREISPEDIPDAPLSTEQSSFLKLLHEKTMMMGNTALVAEDGMDRKRLRVIDKYPWLVPWERNE